jgi:glyoxylase-like metal-dependent hydrolase (beta-lactamase superfamily II)
MLVNLFRKLHLFHQTMLQLFSLTFNPFQENTYIITNEHRDCWIIDPGMYDVGEQDILFRLFEKEQLTPRGIINTHAHIDHVFGVAALVQKYAIPFGLHEKDLPVLNSAAGSAALFGLSLMPVPQPDFFIQENTPLRLGTDELEVRFTPGHSPGSIVFYYAPGQWVVGGDVLFAGNIGRTDLPGGNHAVLLKSIRTQLFTLPDETVVHPGHGVATAIGVEKGML